MLVISIKKSAEALLHTSWHRTKGKKVNIYVFSAGMQEKAMIEALNLLKIQQRSNILRKQQ
jgi:hypothetical protein